MSNAFYNASGNPATGSEGLSALVRNEFAAISTAFDNIPRVQTSGLFDTIFAQSGSFTFVLPGVAGTLALTANITVETTRAQTAEGVLASAITAETTRASAVEALKAPLVSPAFASIPTAPTAAMGTSTTQLATTAFVQAAAGAGGVVSTVAGRTGAVVLAVADVSGAAPLASPALTLVPTAPTATPGTNTTQLATTAFDTAAVLVETTRATTAEGVISTSVTTERTRALAAEATAGRNYLHNQAIDIAQRGLGPFTANGTYTADRWVASSSTGAMSVTVTAVTGYGGNRYVLAHATNAIPAGGYVDFNQRIESVDVARLVGQVVTLSAYCAATTNAGTLSITMYLQTPSIADGWGSSLTTLTSSAQVVSGAPSRVSFTFPALGAGALNGLNVIVRCFQAGATGNVLFNMSNVQLEIGSGPTAMERRPLALELALCQRFFNLVGPVLLQSSAGVAGSSTYQTLCYPVNMRASPTVSGIYASGVNNASQAVVNATVRGFQIALNASAPGEMAVLYTGANLASADL